MAICTGKYNARCRPHAFRFRPWRRSTMQGKVVGAVLFGMSLPLATQADGFIDNWFAMASRSQAEQPHWITPLATVTPRLEQEFRTDYLHEHLPNDTSLDNYGNG